MSPMSRPRSEPRLPSSLGRRLAALALGAAFALASPASATPTTVFAYNHDPTDLFDNNVEAWVWSQLGLLDANGKPIAPIPEAQIIRDGSNAIIGYRSADGTMAAYDLNSGATADQAWQAVADGGTFHVAKHGGTINDGVHGHGGGIALDGGTLHGGFEGGTGSPFEYPYDLTDRDGETIDINLNGCFTESDPDGEGPETSVKESAEGVPGAGEVTGHAGPVYARATWALSGGTTAQQEAAFTALRTAARAAGYPPIRQGEEQAATTNDDVGDWIEALPHQTRYATVQGVIDAAAGAGNVTLQLTHLKDETGGGGEGGTHQHPTLFFPAGGSLSFDYQLTTPVATLVIGPGDLAAAAVFRIGQIAGVEAPAPAGMRLASGIFWFENDGPGALVSPVALSFGFYAQPAAATLRWFDPVGGAWAAPPGIVSIHPGTRIVTLTTLVPGTYAVFAPAPVPALPGAHLVLVAAGLALAAWWIRRRP